MLSNTIEGWNEHLNDGLVCLADIPRGMYRVLFKSWNEHLNDGLECLADIPRDVGCFLIRVKTTQVRLLQLQPPILLSLPAMILECADSQCSITLYYLYWPRVG